MRVIMSQDPFANGAVLLDAASGGTYPLTGDEAMVHFVVPLPVPLDIPDDWETKVARALSRSEFVALPPGFPAQHFKCGIKIFQDQTPMEIPVDVKLAFDLMEQRVLPSSARAMRPEAQGTQDDNRVRPRGRRWWRRREVTAPDSPGLSERLNPDDIPTEYWSYAYLTAPFLLPPSHENVREALIDCLEELRRFQLSVHLDTGRRGPLVALETMPALIPYFVSPVKAPTSSWKEQIRCLSLLSPWHFGRADPPNPASDGRRAAEAMHIQLAHPNHFAHRLFALAAETQLTFGDYHAAVLSAATACEHLLDFVLCQLLWESNFSPEDGARLLRRSLDGRARDLQERLGGDWDIGSTGPFAEWHTRVRRVRNAAIHRGVEPTARQAYDAIDVARRMSEYVGRLLRTHDALERFPRTSYMYNPQKALNAQVRLLLDDPDEPDWIATSTRWRNACDVAVKASRGWPVIDVDGVTEVRVVALIVPNREPRWAVWRPEDGVAALTGQPVDLTAAQIESLGTLATTVDQPSCVQMHEAKVPSVDGDRLVPKGAWVLEHRLIPGYGVMLDRGDLDLLTSEASTSGPSSNQAVDKGQTRE